MSRQGTSRSPRNLPGRARCSRAAKSGPQHRQHGRLEVPQIHVRRGHSGEPPLHLHRRGQREAVPVGAGTVDTGPGHRTLPGVAGQGEPVPVRVVRVRRLLGIELRQQRPYAAVGAALPPVQPGRYIGQQPRCGDETALAPLGVGLGLFTVVVGHATFCIVVVFNNVVARLRRAAGWYEEAAMDLGANTFRVPPVRSAPFAAALGGSDLRRPAAVGGHGDRKPGLTAPGEGWAIE